METVAVYPAARRGVAAGGGAATFESTERRRRRAGAAATSEHGGVDCGELASFRKEMKSKYSRRSLRGRDFVCL